MHAANADLTARASRLIRPSPRPTISEAYKVAALDVMNKFAGGGEVST
jgi:hypothetical protein